MELSKASKLFLYIANTSCAMNMEEIKREILRPRNFFLIINYFAVYLLNNPTRVAEGD